MGGTVEVCLGWAGNVSLANEAKATLSNLVEAAEAGEE
jgi:hypothetical protein